MRSTWVGVIFCCSGQSALDERARIAVMDDLPDDAVSAKTRLLVIDWQPNHLADQPTQAAVKRAAHLIDDAVQGWARLSKSAHHQPQLQVALFLGADGLRHGLDRGPQSRTRSAPTTPVSTPFL